MRAAPRPITRGQASRPGSRDKIASAVAGPARGPDPDLAHFGSLLRLALARMDSSSHLLRPARDAPNSARRGNRYNNASARQWLWHYARLQHANMSRKVPSLADFRRIVVKVGSSLLVDREGGRIKDDWLASLAEDIAGLHRERRDLLVVSSGAIAFGRVVLKLPAG